MLSRTCILFAAVCCSTVNLLAADASMAGRWKIDFGKSKITGFKETIEDVGNHEMKFIFGDDSEIYVFDGKEHATRYGSMRTVTPEGPDQWKALNKREGKVTATDTWTLGDGGKALTVLTEGTHADGSAFKQEFLFKRIAGTAGLAGTWESTKVDPDAYADWVIESAEGDGMTFSVPVYKELHRIKFDGKDYPAEGPRVAPGATTSGKRIDGLTVELTDKLKGKVTDTMRLELSADGKTLNATISYPGIEQKEVDVWERQ